MVDIDKLMNSQKRNGQLVIPSNTFYPYSFIELKAFISDNNSTILAETELSLNILPTLPSVILSVANGTYPSSSSIKVNVKIDYELNLEDYFDIYWNCSNLQSYCEETSTSDFTLKINSKHLEKNVKYEFHLMFASKLSGSSHSALRSLSLTVKPNLIPLVNIYEKYSDKQPSIFGMNKPIILQSSISSNPKAESFSWSIISETPLNLYPSNQSSISIKPADLISGSYYKLELKITFSNKNIGSYTYEFTVNSLIGGTYTG